MLALAGCSGSGSGSGEAGVINVQEAIQNPRPLKLSDLGSSVRFVRLETTDSSLVSDQWRGFVYGDKIMIGNNRSIMTGGEQLGRAMVFDINTGKFITSAGSQGQGPGEYFSPNPMAMNPATGDTYFTGSNAKGWVVYSIDGLYKNTFMGDVTPEIGGRRLATVTERGPVLMREVKGPTRAMAIYNYTPGGEMLDSVVILAGTKGPERGALHFDGPVTFFSHDTPLGGSVSEVVVGDKHQPFVYGSVYLASDGLHYHESLCDTVYTLADGGKPVLTFSLGENFKPVENIRDDWYGDDDLIVTDVIESPSKVIFGISRGWLGQDNHTEWIGVYDRESGTTAMGPAKEGFADDLTGFMPVIPRQVLPDGTLMGWLTMEQISDWLEEHPDAERPDWLGEVDAEDNPVLVLIK